MPLSKEIKDRIAKEADVFSTGTSVCAGEFDAREQGYIAGAEAEAERAAGLVEALEKISNGFLNSDEDWAADLAAEALTNYNNSK